jgi:uncharacterized protein YbaP (TraB family)
MKKYTVLLALIVGFHHLYAQPVIRNKKYPSLLWEITGNGLKKPSYLIGTMHVSSKMAFHLPDSFYIALKKADVVALETNPEYWQEEMTRYDFGEDDNTDYSDLLRGGPDEYLALNTLQFYKYDNKLQRAISSSPSAINSLLYRSYGNDESDFEEDTYLDMYIFQCGKKLGKRVCGVENYGESMRLMAEAYRDGAKDKNKKERSYGDYDQAYSADKLQEAYRLGNLDLLDSINKFNSTSAAFDEKFLYQRNVIQALSIDSILRSGSELFVGVGAAHLPGDRGVIELLRSRGYHLRPVTMGERANHEKDMIDKMKVPVSFHNYTARDGAFQVQVPGKLYKSGEDDALDQEEYADMSNGSYYVITRVMTNAWMFGHNEARVFSTVDSLLYENIPGKIISKKVISRGGYKGFDIINRTRRGDIQRYNIFITPFEVLFFKMSGNGEYVRTGTEAEKFFGSIQLKEYKNQTPVTGKYSPPYGGFAIELPHQPYIGNDGSWIYDAEDLNTGTNYRVIRTDIHNHHFIEEDSFDLGLLNESFMASDFIDSQLYRHQTTYKGYPALDAKFAAKDGSAYLVRFVIQGPHYYSLVAHGRTETPAMQQFLNSFEIKPFTYASLTSHADTSLYFSVRTTYFPEQKKIRFSIPKFSYIGSEDDEPGNEKQKLQNGVYRHRIISDDSTGEKIYVTFLRMSRYQFIRDSTAFDEELSANLDDSTCIYRLRKRSRLPGGLLTWENIISDTNSSRTLWTKVFYKNGNVYTLRTESDTLSPATSFIQSFYENFSPVDPAVDVDPYAKKSPLFFADLNSTDSSIHDMAVRHLRDVPLDSTDLPALQDAISSINWNQKKYLDTKVMLIGKLGSIRNNRVTDFLNNLFYAANDTVQLQYAALENLLQQRTLYAYRLFSKVMSNDPPVMTEPGFNYSSHISDDLLRKISMRTMGDNGGFFDELDDSLNLTRAIIGDLLPLINLQDYERNMMRLLSRLVDSGYISAVDYESYFGKLYIEAKQELKKQAIAEKKKSIAKAEEEKAPDKVTSDLGSDDDDGNTGLGLYASLLLPFEGKNPNVNTIIAQMLGSDDLRLRYNTLLLLLDRKKPVPDSLISFFASREEYRYELYSDLKERQLLHRFPEAYNTHLLLGRSILLERASYDKPDTVSYVDRRKVSYDGKNGFFYFFRYKAKKDDASWKLAVVGMTTEDPGKFEFEDKETYALFNDYSGSSLYDFTTYTNTRLKEDEPLAPQLDKVVRKLLYSRKKSAKEFYPEDQAGTREVFD